MFKYLCCTFVVVFICEKTFFCLIYSAPRINSSSVLCQTRDHLLSKTFHQRGKTFWKTPNSICTGNDPKLEGVSLLLLCLTQVLFTSIRNGVSPETLKAERHLTRRTNSEYQMSEKECYKKSENFQTSFYAKNKNKMALLLFLSQQYSLCNIIPK